MITTLTAIFTMLTSGAGGGIVGGIFGIFKQSQERKERVDMAKINLRRDQMEYQNAEAERAHALTMLEKGGEIDLLMAETEAEAEADIQHQKTLASAQGALKKLNTSTGMDNYRASVRPTLAYWGAVLFTAMICWAFYKYHPTIDAETGRSILIGMFSTLTFITTSIVTFYYVARSNRAPK